MPPFLPKDGLDFLNWSNRSNSVRGIVSLDNGFWQDARMRVNDMLHERGCGNFMVLLGNEVHLTQNWCELLIRVENSSDIAKAQEVMDLLSVERGA